jgi:hypothetical protein
MDISFTVRLSGFRRSLPTEPSRFGGDIPMRAALVVIGAFLFSQVAGAQVPACAVTQDQTTSVADVQLIVNEALGTAPAINDLSSDGVVNVVDVQIAINAALGLGCLATVIPETTKVLDQTGTAALTISADGSTLTMPGQSAVARSLQVGDVLATGPTSAAPHGLLRKIVSVNQTGGQVIAVTTQAALTDAIQQANIQVNAVLLPQSIKSMAALRRGVAVYRGRPGSAGAAAGGLTSANPMQAASDVCSSSQIVVTEMQDVELTPGLDVTGEIELCGNFAIQANVNWLGLHLNALTATATFAEHTDLTMTGSVAQLFSGTQPIATIQFDDIVVPVGPIPVVVTPEVTIQIRASVTGVFFTAGVSQNASVTGGFAYANGQVSPILQFTPLTFQTEPLTVTADLTATASIEADMDLLFYDIAGPYFDPQAYLQFDANVAQNPWWTLSGGLQGPVGLQLNPDLDVFGFDNLPSISVGNLFNISRTFLSAGLGFPVLGSLSPNTAPAGSEALALTLMGSNFTSGATANFNGVPLSTTFVSASQLTATLPASYLTAAGVFPVTVVNPGTGGATSAPVDFTVQAAGNPLPAITNLSPPSATVGSAPLPLKVNGSGFVASSSVTFNGAPRVPTLLSSAQLTIMLSTSDLAVAGAFAVVVTNPSPGGGSSNALNFMVQASPPTAGFSMSSGTQVATDGQSLNLSTASGNSVTVTFDGSVRSSAVNGATITGWQWTLDGSSAASTSSFSQSLATGTHTVALVVTDSRGAQSGQATGTVVVAVATCPNGGITLVTADDLNTLVRNNLSGYYCLGADIDLSSVPNWIPIGDSNNPFNGTLDGFNHRIANLTISASAGQVGLFGVMSGGSIVNVGLSNVSIQVTVSTPNTYPSIGSLVGVSQSGSIVASYATGQINVNVVGAGSGTSTGGLIGTLGGSLAQSYAGVAVLVTGGTMGGGGIGGLVGTACCAVESTNTITRAFSTGSVTTRAVTNENYASGVGGLIGSNGAMIQQSYSTGNVDSDTSTTMGGLVGFAAWDVGSISLSFATGSVNGGDGSRVGGLVGWVFDVSVSQSYSVGDVAGGAGSMVGGLAGQNGGGCTPCSASISQSYAVGHVNAGAGSTVGGLLAVKGSDGSVVDSVWDLNRSGQSASAGGSGLTTDQLQSGALPSGFDPAVWTAAHGQYPTLSWQVLSGVPGTIDTGLSLMITPSGMLPAFSIAAL